MSLLRLPPLRAVVRRAVPARRREIIGFAARAASSMAEDQQKV
jgi:hypothetical protein